MAGYRRRRKRSDRPYSGMRKPYSGMRRPYIPKLGGGGYGGPKNYFRTHDFKYGREPTSRPPKTETRYEIVERPSTESRRQPTLYRPELDQDSVERVVGQSIEHYFRNNAERMQEREQEQQTPEHTDLAPSSKSQELEIQKTEPLTTEADSTPIEDGTPEVDLNELPSQAEPLLDISQEVGPSSTEKGPELYESYELPINDLELLLVELDAYPFETQPEKNVDAEPGREQ